MEGNKINRFCELVIKINQTNIWLQEAKATYYDGGYSFEECHSFHIEDLQKAQQELQELLIDLTK